MEDNKSKELAEEYSEPKSIAEEYSLPEYFVLTREGMFVEYDVNVRIKYLPHFKGLPEIKKATPGSAGYDLYAAIPENEPVWLNTVGSIAVVPTGISVELPENYELQVRPRSGLAAKHGITCANCIGTIDSDYRGEIFAILVNLTPNKFKITRGMKIAQAVVPAKLPVVNLEIVSEISDTERGSGGLGSTGL